MHAHQQELGESIITTLTPTLAASIPGNNMMLPPVTVYTTVLWNDPKHLPYRDCPCTRQRYYFIYCLEWNPNDRVTAPQLVHITNEKGVKKNCRLVKNPSPSDTTCIPIAKMHESVAESTEILKVRHPLYADKFI
jgi:hypothetical protein